MKTRSLQLIVSISIFISSCSSSYTPPDVRFTLDEEQLPDYENDINHKELFLIAERSESSIQRGEQIYGTVCFNCHGDPHQNGSIPTAFKFWSDTFKVRNDPYAMYQTITRGYGSMPPQTNLTPREKYDVISFIRNRFIAEQNKSQYFRIDSGYVNSLPKGNFHGPEPLEYKPWAEMDYGNFLINTYELAGKDTKPRNMSRGPNAPLPDEDFSTSNFAYKGIAIRLDKGEGGIAAGKVWMIFDHDVMRVAGGWTGEGFIDWQGILFNGRHNISPRTVGQLRFANPVGPGWANPENGSFEDTRFKARDNRRFGPLPRRWAHYKGLYQHSGRTIISYTVGKTPVLEAFGLDSLNDQPVFIRTLNIGSGTALLKMRIAPVGCAVALRGNGATLVRRDGFHVLETTSNTRIKLFISGTDTTALSRFAASSSPPESLDSLTRGGPAQYARKLVAPIVEGNNDGSFQVDVLCPPFNSPWKNQLRLSGIDFPEDKDKAFVCAADGDVWYIEGLLHNRQSLTWQRIASGLFQPLGIKVVNNRVVVTCRDQIVVLHDLNGDMETDFYESFNSDHQVTDHFHEFAMGLQADGEGNLYYAKSARHAREALVPQHGTLIRVSKDGLKTEIIARGFRAANGVCLNPDGSFIVTDQEGHWNPMNRINWVEKGKFYGNMFGYDPPKDSSDQGMVKPLAWVERNHDQSPSELLWVDSEKWGPLNGSLLNLSYGYGKLFLVPHEKTDYGMQGGIVELPVPRFSTGIMRGRFNPDDGALYVCGLSAWGSTQTLQLGGLYRVRYTDNGKDILPVKLHAARNGVRITFTHPIESQSAESIQHFRVESWSLLRSRNYGSDHYNEKNLTVTKATLEADGKSVFLTIPSITPTDVMEIHYDLKGLEGNPVKGVIQHTIHQLLSEK